MRSVSCADCPVKFQIIKPVFLVATSQIFRVNVLHSKKFSFKNLFNLRIYNKPFINATDSVVGVYKKFITENPVRHTKIVQLSQSNLGKGCFITI